MKFTVNTKPVVDGLELGIITSNVTKFYKKSCIVQLTVDGESLRINTEASAIKSELVFKGSVSGEGADRVFVDSLLFKQLMKTIDTDIVEFELKEDGLTVRSGKSKFNLPQVVSSEDVELSRPQYVETPTDVFDIEGESWDFVKNQQMYAIAMSFITPVYTNVWVGNNKDVIVGDFDNGIFTHSTKVSLPSTCLLPDTIINLLTTVPANSSIIHLGNNYEIKVNTDPYSYVCEFTPKYEEDEGVGSYEADIVLGLFEHTEQPIHLKLDEVLKYLNQAELFATATDDTIDVKVDNETFSLVNHNVNCKVPVTNGFGEFAVTFKIALLKDALSHMDQSEVDIAPIYVDGDDGQSEVSGIKIWTNTLDTVLSGVENGV